MTPTVCAGTHALRVAFGNWRTSEADTDQVFEAVKRHCPVGSADENGR